MHRKHLQKDKLIWTAVKKQAELGPRSEKNLHLGLCSSIISQQLSTKVAAVIYGRFLGLFNKKAPSVNDILLKDKEELRSIGLSYSKAQYVFNVCNFFKEKKLTDKKLQAMEDEQLIELLTEIKGIGRWTAEMILMFSLGREDVFAADDLGIQQGMIKLYGLDPSNKKKLKTDMLKIAEQWRPYRTYACRYIWAWKDAG